MAEWPLILIGVVVGAALGALIATLRSQSAAARAQAELGAKLAAAEAGATGLQAQLTARDESARALQRDLEQRGQEIIRVTTQSEELRRRLAEQERMLGETELRLKESFASLSAQALQANAQQFLSEARKTLDVVLAEAKGDLGKREEAIKGLVQPVAESLRQYETHVQAIERSRHSEYGSLQEQLRQLAVTQQTLQQETGKLVTALRDPKVRGRWGELALRRTVELAGMVEHSDFEQQASFEGEDARLRPDLRVHLPGGRSVAVDAKAVLDAYLDAVGATDDVTRQAHLKRHAAQVRSRMRELSSKAYWDRLGTSPEFVVLFLPGEAFFSAALEADPTLIEDAIAQRIVPASPTTLIALLRAIAHGWRQARMVENADRLGTLGKDLFERLCTFVDHMDKLGASLGGAVGAFNKAVGSLESRVLPSGRKLAEMGAGNVAELSEIAAIELVPRQL